MKFRLKSLDTFPQVARKLAHLYNEEARLALLDSASGERAEELLQQAQHWMAGILKNFGQRFIWFIDLVEIFNETSGSMILSLNRILSMFNMSLLIDSRRR